MIAGPDAPHSGQAKNSWLTGTASWNYVAITQYLLGIRPEHNGLRIAPTIVPQTGPFRVTRSCRGAVYNITASQANPDQQPGLYVNGVRRDSDVVAFAEEGSEVAIECLVARA